MKRWFLCQWVLISGLTFWGNIANASSSFVIVTDIDDTLKISHINSIPGAIYQGIWGNDTFSGMAELFQELYHQAREVVYLSAAPQSTIGAIENTLVVSHHFPPGYFRLDNWWSWQDAAKFKKTELDLLRNNPVLGELPFLTFGDDVQQDAEIYLEFARAHLELQKGFPIYIHQIAGRSLPEGVIPYFTAFDVAWHEVEFGRLTPSQAIRVGRTILDASQIELLIPQFAICPRELNYPLEQMEAVDHEFLEVANLIKEKVESYCLGAVPGHHSKVSMEVQ